jgi:hypothetical protein
MRRLRAGIVIGAVAAVVLPGVAAAQCEGGMTTGGYYLSTGAYVSGGCSFTNPTTTGQMHPSGAQVVPSTNPVAGTTRLPGQRVPASQQPTILDTVNGSYGPLGPLTSNAAFTTTAGPGARLAPGGAGLLPNTTTDNGATNILVDQAAAGGVASNVAQPVVPSAMGAATVGVVPNAVSVVPETFDPLPAQPNTTGLSAGNTAAVPGDDALGAPSAANRAAVAAGLSSGAQVVAPATENGQTTTSRVATSVSVRLKPDPHCG